jgi:hypothetical protein
VVANRAVIEVDARPRTSHGLWPHWLPAGADEYGLAFDAKHGHLLRIEGRSASHAFEVIEITAISYPHDIPTHLFDDPTLPSDRLLPPQQQP